MRVGPMGWVVLVLVGAMLGPLATAADQPAKPVTELPCPDPKPAFDWAAIDRTLREPSYGPGRAAYRFLAFGPEGKTLVAMVAVESRGPGQGADVLHVDLNANGDITEPGERFALGKPQKMAPLRGGPGDLVLVRLAGWAVTAVPGGRLPVPDPAFTYALTVGSGYVKVDTTAADGSWSCPMVVMDNEVPWSTSKDRAPVIRFGGRQFSLGNEDILHRDGKRLGGAAGGGPVHVAPGDNIRLDGTAPFFLGSSPSVPVGFQGVYCPGGHRGIRASVLVGPGRVDLPFYPSCGGHYWASVLVGASWPPGEASVVLSMDTGPYLGTVVKRVPFVVDNPLFGQPIEPLAETVRLRGRHPDATVLELYHEAPLAALGVPSYDGVRDVYFGDGREVPFGGSCQNTGNHISYGTELRCRLDLGGEGRRTLIKYDLSMLPKGIEVRRAVLMLHVEGVNPKVRLDGRAYALKKRWHESIVGVMGGLNDTNEAVPPRVKYPVGGVENWDEPMFKGPGDRSSEPIGSATFAAAGWTAVDVTAGVRNWIGGAWANHGLALETVQERAAYGTKDVWMTASDSPVDPRLRPRLVVVLAGELKPAPCRVEELRPDLAAARANARAAGGRPILCNILSAGSLTSRALERRVLSAAGVKRFIDEHFVEMRIDGDDPRHRELLRRYGVRRLPTTLVLPADETPDNFAILEPFDWDAMDGLPPSSFEFEQVYTGRLQAILEHAARNGGRLAVPQSAATCGP